MSDPKIDARARLRHDLRTPLHQIIGYAELIADEARDAGHEEYLSDLQKVRSAALRALELVDESFPAGGETARPAVLGNGQDDPPPRGTDPAQASQPLRPPPEPLVPSSVSLLVVDDNELNRDMLSRRLGARGFDVEVAEDGHSALARLDAREFDLVLLDVMMPGLTGIDVLKKVRERVSESDLPIVMATARDATEDVPEIASV